MHLGWAATAVTLLVADVALGAARSAKHKAKTHVSADASRDPLRSDRASRAVDALAPTAEEQRLGAAIIKEAHRAQYWGRPFCWIANQKHVEGCDSAEAKDIDALLKIDRSGAVEEVRVRLRDEGPADSTLAMPFDPTTRFGLFCAGYSLQVLLSVMKREDLFREMDKSELRALRATWFGWDQDFTIRGRLFGRLDVARRQSELGLTALSLGHAVGRLADGRPHTIAGDFLVFRFDSGRLHTGIFDHWVMYKGKPVGVSFIGANLEGVGRKFYCFRDDDAVERMPDNIHDEWCSAKPRIRKAALYAARLSPKLASKAR